MALFSANGGFPAFVRALIDDVGNVESLTDSTGIAAHRLVHWSDGGDDHTRDEEWTLYEFCLQHHKYGLLEAFAAPSDDTQLLKRSTRIAGLEVNFPLGIGASVLTANSAAIVALAGRGFDILTYKTVRSRRWAPHPDPTWAFARPDSVIDFTPKSSKPVIADVTYRPDDTRRATMVNSFGIPSSEPVIWMGDVARAKRLLNPGQILVVSVVASVPGGGSFQDVIDDFVEVARLAKEAGADAIEANFSCPNDPDPDNPDPDAPTGGKAGALLYESPEQVARVTEAMKSALGETPLFIKIGYLGKESLGTLVAATRKWADAIVAINTISSLIVAPNGHPFFPPRENDGDRDRAGVSGAVIRPWAQEVVRNLVEFRGARGGSDDFAIIAVGGVASPEDVEAYLEMGADAVEACTGAYLNPSLALETRAPQVRIADQVIEMLSPAGARPVDELAQRLVPTVSLGALTASLESLEATGVIEISGPIGDATVALTPRGRELVVTSGS